MIRASVVGSYDSLRAVGISGVWPRCGESTKARKERRVLKVEFQFSVQALGEFRMLGFNFSV